VVDSKKLLIRRGLPVRFVSAAIERKHFGELTQGNQIRFTVDGEETFNLIYEAINQAESSIYIAGYDLDPYLNFVRESSDDATKTSNINASVASNKPSSQSWSKSSRHAKGNVLTETEYLRKDQDSFLSSPGTTRTGQNSLTDVPYSITSKRRVKGRHSYKRFQELIIGKAKNGTFVRIIVWQPRLPLRILPGADERGLDGRAEEVEVLNKLAIKYGIEQNLIVKIDSTSPTLSSAHHEKIIVIDNKIGFCGGFDLSRGKWDRSKHAYYDPLRDPDSEPWHDIHAMMKGPIVWDLAYHFNQRWAYYEVKDEEKVRAMDLRPAQVPVKIVRGGAKIVALRTWEGMEKDGGILAWYANTIRKAKNSIYVENQFPFQNEFITRILCKRLQEQKSLKVIIVGPMEPNLPGLIGSILSKTSVNDVNKHLKLIRDAGDSGKRVGTYSLVCQDKKTKKLRQIYLHSKLLIVDDKWIAIGSANTDKNGFKDSTEVNLGITSRSLARELRIRLWSEHIGLLEKTGGLTRKELANSFDIDRKRSPPRRKLETSSYLNCLNIRDFEKGFEIWKKISEHNGSSVSKGSNIMGHLYYYNFEERNFPPPYPEAKGASKFSLF
jgi:phosphatidylserine/phosphatidylglycerophosphate/cardiolipin synthase-like enzyme